MKTAAQQFRLDLADARVTVRQLQLMLPTLIERAPEELQGDLIAFDTRLIDLDLKLNDLAQRAIDLVRDATTATDSTDDGTDGDISIH